MRLRRSANFPNALWVLRCGQIWRLCKAEDLVVHVSDKGDSGVSFQEIVDHFILTGQSSLLSALIRLRQWGHQRIQGGSGRLSHGEV